MKYIAILITCLLASNVYAMTEDNNETIVGSKSYFDKMAFGDYSPPIKVNNYDSFLYVYGLLLDYEINAPIPLANQDKLNQLKNKCRTIGRMLMTKDFLLFNKEFTNQEILNRYTNDEMLKSYTKDVGANCKAINELLKNK